MAFGNFLVRKQKLNHFYMPSERGFTCNMGELVPIFAEEVMPGDVWKMKSMALVRLQPMIAPIMHNINIFTHYFFVPYRLVHDNWEPFITGGEDGKDATPIPLVKSPDDGKGWQPGSVMDYLGYATGAPGFSAEAYFIRAYNLIYNDWYRNQNFIDEVSLSKGDGLDTTTSQQLLKRAWQADYFTDCLPWAQRGDTINLPLGVSAPVQVMGNGKALGFSNGSHPTVISAGSSGAVWYSNPNNYNLGVVPGGTLDNGNYNRGVNVDPTLSGLTGIADLTDATATTVNDLRDAVQLQVAAEIAARVGGRYVEYLLGNFGVRSADSRLQRPEYLGGGRSSILVSQVLQTSSTDATTPQGNMAGHGISVNSSHAFKKRFTEHGCIIGIMSIMPDTKYFQGSRRHFNRRSRLDFPVPVFSHLGEQQVLEKEIFAQGDGKSTNIGGISVSDETTFGFLPRYEEMRYIPSTIHGDFKDTLKFWTLAREFTQPPLLNADFVNCNPSKRVFAVTDEAYDSCIVNIGFQTHAYRPLPKQGIPGYLDHLF